VLTQIPRERMTDAPARARDGDDHALSWIIVSYRNASVYARTDL
jgi:hypothetical protein